MRLPFGGHCGVSFGQLVSLCVVIDGSSCIDSVVISGHSVIWYYWSSFIDHVVLLSLVVIDGH